MDIQMNMKRSYLTEVPILGPITNDNYDCIVIYVSHTLRDKKT